MLFRSAFNFRVYRKPSGDVITKKLIKIEPNISESIIGGEQWNCFGVLLKIRCFFSYRRWLSFLPNF